MKEKSILKIALFCSIIGILVLVLVSRNMDFNDYNVLNMKGDDVIVKGKIEEISLRDGVVFLKVNHSSSIEVILFTKEDVNMQKGDIIEATGKIDEYKGKREIIAQNVKVLR